MIKEWSCATLALYIALALVTALLFRQSVIDKKKDKKITKFKLCIKTKYIYYIIIYLLFILFACFKYMGDGLVGADTLSYLDFFENLNYVHFDIKETLLLNSYEYLFYNTMYIVNMLGGTYRTFLFIVNSLMICSLIYFVDKEVHDESKCKWLILAYLPLLKSLNIVRNCVAAFWGFVSISLLSKKKTLLSILFAFIAFLNHYIAVVLFGLILFYKLYPNKLMDSRKKILITTVACIVVSILAIPLLKVVLYNTGYAAYIDKLDLANISLWGYIPYMLLFLFMIIDKGFIEYLEKQNHLGYYKIIYFFILTLPVFIIVNAAYRVILFFELPVILLFADATEYIKKYINKKHIKIYNYMCVFVVLGYYVFKIWRMWDVAGIMPYYNILFMK